MSSSSQKQQKNTPTANSKLTSRLQQAKVEQTKEKEEVKNNFSQLRVPRRNKGKVASNSQQAFNNSILLLEYENEEEPRVDSSHKSRERRESPKSEEEDQMVSAVVNSCMRVITEDTEHSSNPITARYPPECQSADLDMHINASYSAANMPMMMQMSDGYYYHYLLKNPAVRNRRAISNEESRAYVIDVKGIENDGRTTIMIRNIPNKYTQDMLLERFEENHKKKFDFFYLPIDYNVLGLLLRTTATWATLSSISSIPSSSRTSTGSSITRHGRNSTHRRCVRCATRVSRVRRSCSTTSSIRT
jgi:hypothetical protein